MKMLGGLAWVVSRWSAYLTCLNMIYTVVFVCPNAVGTSETGVLHHLACTRKTSAGGWHLPDGLKVKLSLVQSDKSQKTQLTAELQNALVIAMMPPQRRKMNAAREGKSQAVESSDLGGMTFFSLSGQDDGYFEVSSEKMRKVWVSGRMVRCEFIHQQPTHISSRGETLCLFKASQDQS